MRFAGTFRPLISVLLRPLSTMTTFAELPTVDIDPSGTFKYILIEAKEKGTGKAKMIVRGYSRCPFHGDVLDETEQTVATSVSLVCKGGGRIKHEPAKHSILVYGYSQGYGKADHAKSVELLKDAYPDYEVTWSDEGY